MIEYLAYDFGLILFTRFKVFKKYRDAMSFRTSFLLGLVSIIVFIMSCYKMLTNTTFLGLDTRNPILRKIVFLLFLGTKITIFGYLVSGYFREKSDLKVPIAGLKGTRGKRGSSGKKAEECDEQKCNVNICDKKILDNISRVYSKILINKGKKGSKHYSIVNHFIKNKVKILCQSSQLNKILNNINSSKEQNEIYDFINKTWEKWINIIMQYKNGEYFMETDYLTDNDFNNLIEDQDKLYNKNFDNINIGTPSRGLESPFDEIKKYDMWYWGEPEAAKVKIVYKCDIDKDAQDSKKYNL